MHRRIVRASLGLLVVMALSGCNSSGVQLNREWDDPAEEEAAWEAQSPEGFVERFGEPDSWANEGEGQDLRMTAVWNCVDGRTREVRWRQQDSSKGLRRWVVLSDTSREGCKE